MSHNRAEGPKRVAARTPGAETPPRAPEAVDEAEAARVGVPAGNATTEEWRAYARRLANDSDEAAAIERMGRDELRETYGG